MDVRCLLMSSLAAVFLGGCTVSGSKDVNCEKDKSVNISPLIGLIGMAVDGDDKDDYEHFFDDPDCKCKCKKCRH